jgi:glutamate carboxypeptidase
MQTVVSNSLNGTSAEIIFNEGYPPLGRTKGNTDLLAQYSQVSEDLGFGSVAAVHPIRAGAADISFTSGYVDMALDGLGLSGGNDHTAQEFALINRLPDLTKRAAILLMRLSR